MGLVALGVVILITMLLCSCGSNPIAPPIDPPPVEPPIEMPEGAVVAYEDSAYTVLYDVESVYVYFHSGGGGHKFYIQPMTQPTYFWDVKTQEGYDAYLTWHDYPYLEEWNEHEDAFNNVTLIDEVWVEDSPCYSTLHTLISFPRYGLDPEGDCRIETGNYNIAISPVDYDELYWPYTGIYID